jgi:hypothetical protein
MYNRSMRTDDLQISKQEKLVLEHFFRFRDLNTLAVKTGVYDCEIPDILDYLLCQALIEIAEIPRVNGTRETYKLTAKGKTILRQLGIPFYKKNSFYVVLGTMLTAIFTGILAIITLTN